jgi:hypothetical protein
MRQYSHARARVNGTALDATTVAVAAILKINFIALLFVRLLVLTEVIGRGANLEGSSVLASDLRSENIGPARLPKQLIVRSAGKTM